MNTASLTQQDVESIGAGWARAALKRALAKDTDWTCTSSGVPAFAVEKHQRGFGDYEGKFAHDGMKHALEVKSEREYTGNVFLEVWSNWCPDARYRREGWLVTLDATSYIAFAFLDIEHVYTTDFHMLREWMMTGDRAVIYRLRQPRLTVTGGQKNNTLGYAVPIVDIVKANIPVRRYVRNPQTDTWTRSTVEASK